MDNITNTSQRVNDVWVANERFKLKVSSSSIIKINNADRENIILQRVRSVNVQINELCDIQQCVNTAIINQ